MFHDARSQRQTSHPAEPGLDLTTAAVTTLSFNFRTGKIYDVDVELNSSNMNFTLSEENVEIDLLSIVTHEVGHFLGIDHSSNTTATMISYYEPGSTKKRSLDKDDQEAICATYSPDRLLPEINTCDPRGTYSARCTNDPGCGCQVFKSESNRSRSSLLSISLIASLLCLRRRRLEGH